MWAGAHVECVTRISTHHRVSYGGWRGWQADEKYEVQTGDEITYELADGACWGWGLVFDAVLRQFDRERVPTRAGVPRAVVGVADGALKLEPRLLAPLSCRSLSPNGKW